MTSVPPYHLPSQRLFEVDWAALSEIELLALLLGPGSQESRALCDAQRLLETVGCLQRLKEASYSEICSGGLSKKKALAVLAAIREAAAGVVFVHNHPSGDPNPSREDVEITERLVKSGQLVGIRALDHVIMGTDQYFSFADQGLLLNRSLGGHS